MAFRSSFHGVSDLGMRMQHDFGQEERAKESAGFHL